MGRFQPACEMPGKIPCFAESLSSQIAMSGLALLHPEVFAIPDHQLIAEALRLELQHTVTNDWLLQQILSSPTFKGFLILCREYKMVEPIQERV